MRLASLITSAAVIASVALGVACVGGPGSLGTFGDDGEEGRQQGSSGSSGTSSGQTDPPSTSSSTSGGIGTSSTSSSSSTSSGSSGFDAGQPFACGSTTCQASQWCVTPCCGGAQPQCYAPDSGTLCPTGYSYKFCANLGTSGCEQDPCTPPPPYCVSSTTAVPQGCTRTSSTSRNYECVCP